MNETREDFERYFEDRFGIPPSTWERCRVVIGSRSVYLHARGIPEEHPYEVQVAGLRAARLTTESFKPTTALVQRIGERIEKNRVFLSPRALERMIDRELAQETMLEVDSELTRGYVAMYFRELPVGCGFWTGQELRTQLPKALCQNFPREILSTKD